MNYHYTKKHRSRKMKKFIKFLIIWGSVLAGLCVVGLSVLALYLHTYESNLPEKTAEKYAAELGEAELTELVSARLDALSPFETAELIFSRSESLSGEIRAEKYAKEYTSEKPVYRLICGENDIGVLTLKKAAKNALFGITAWEVDSSELYDEAIKGGATKKDLSIIVPKDASVKVNGIELGSEYKTNDDAAYSGNAILKNKETLCDTYAVKGLYTKAEVEVSEGGKTEELYCTRELADYYSSPERAFMLTLPSDAGASVDGEYISGKRLRGELTEALSEFEKELGDKLPSYVSYIVEGSRDSARVSVSLRGKELSGSWFGGDDALDNVVFLYSEESKYSLRVTIPSDATLYVNGVAADKKYVIGKGPYAVTGAISYLTEDKDSLSGDLYEISGLLCVPEISVKIGETALPLCYSAEELRTFKADYCGLPDAELFTQTSAYAEDFVRAYIKCLADGANGYEENTAAILEKMQKKSPGAKALERSKDSFQYINPLKNVVNYVTPRDFVKLGEDIFLCFVDFSADLSFYQNEKHYEGTFTLIYVNTAEGPLVCDFIVESVG